MRLRVKIREGVEAGLCGSCQHARVMEDVDNRVMVMCEENHPFLVITRPLKRCTDYQARGTLDKYEMERIAWILDVKGGRIRGFVPPKKKEE